MLSLTENKGRACRNEAHLSSNSRQPNARLWKPSPGDIQHRIETSSGPRSCSWRLAVSRTRRSRVACPCPPRSSPSGASVSSINACPAWRNSRARVGRQSFPPTVVVECKALACEYRPASVCRSLDSTFRTCGPSSSAAASWPRSPTRRSGGGSPPTPSGRGRIAAGSFPATPTSRPRPAGCWICTRAGLRASGCGLMST